MPRRVKKNKPALANLADNFVQKVAATDVRTRKRLVRLGTWAIVIATLWSLMSGMYGLPRIVRLEMKRQSLIDANRRLTAELVDASILRKKLIDDPQYIEYIARSRYYMVYPNESLYRYRIR